MNRVYMSNKMKGNKKEIVLQMALKMGLFDLVLRVFPRTLTVLNYHRIDDPHTEGFSTFKSNVSATASMFDLQMKYLEKKYNVVSATDVVRWVRGDAQLPPRAALITFDDGYYDNYKYALPVLKARRLPAIIFLASNYMGSSVPFYWDLIAHCFYKTDKDYLDIPSMGSYSWKDDASKGAVAKQIIEALKSMRELDKVKVVDSISALLDVSPSKDTFEGMFLSWSEVREMVENGIEMGAHTASHPILTRISPDDAKAEIIRSKNRVEEETGAPVHSFAYPNGQQTDFNADVIKAVQDSGLQAAYTLLPGPTRFDTVKKEPFQIRRIFLSHKDTFPKFVGKLSGLSRFS